MGDDRALEDVPQTVARLDRGLGDLEGKLSRFLPNPGLDALGTTRTSIDPSTGRSRLYDAAGVLRTAIDGDLGQHRIYDAAGVLRYSADAVAGLVQHFDSTGRLRVQVGNIPGLGGNHGTILWAGSGALGARGIVDHVDDPSFPAVEVAHNYRTHLVAPTVATYATAGAVWTVGDAPLTQLVARTGGFGVAFACPSHGASLLLYSNGLSAMNGAATAFAPIAASAFNVSSSVEVKEDLIDVNDDVLDKLEAADIKWWRYTQDKVPPPAPEPELRPVYRDDGTMTLVEEQVVLDHRPVSDDPPWHLGPMWEDLPEGINQDNPAHGKQVDVRDLAGWALAVGQKLIAQNRGQAEEMKTLRAELDELKATVAALAKA